MVYMREVSKEGLDVALVVKVGIMPRLDSMI